MVNSREDVEPFVIRHLMSCFRDTQSRLLGAENDKELEYFQPWITSDVFRDYLDELPFCEVPETALLNKFPSVARMLLRRFLCLPMGSGAYSHSAAVFNIRRKAKGEEEENRPLNERWLWAPSNNVNE